MYTEPTKIFLFILVALASWPGSARADTLTEGWSLGVGCPGAGNTYIGGNFISSTRSGFSGSGKCTRTPTAFTKFQYQQHAGGTLNSSTQFGVHTGDVMILPPTLDSDTAPIFTVAPSCPFTNKNMNWIYVEFAPGTAALTGVGLLGQAVYSTTSGVSVRSSLDLAMASVSNSPVSLAGTCANGVYTLTGSGDRSGKIYLTYTGSGVYKSDANHSLFFLPHQNFSVASVLGGNKFSGILFTSKPGATTYPVQSSVSANGLTWTITPYSNPENGTTSSAFTDTITVSATNTPFDGALSGTISRNSGGTGRIACIAATGLSSRVICTGESPDDNRYPYSVIFASDPFVTLGQPTPMSQQQYESGFNSPSHSFYDGTHFFVVDHNNNRVLIWNGIPSKLQTADLVLGQGTLSTAFAGDEYSVNGYTASTLNHPNVVWSDGTRVIVGDTYRLLIWNTFPTTNGAPADVVLGQPDLNTVNSPMWLSTYDATTVYEPDGVYVGGGRLYMLDGNMNRILVWNAVPTVNNTPADFQIGQVDFTASRSLSPSGTPSSSNFFFPASMTSDGSHLAIADSWGQRALIYNGLPTDQSASAAAEFGQYEWDYDYFNWPSFNNQSLQYPTGAAISGTHFWVADRGNSRVLQFNHIPTSNWEGADLVLGAPDFSTYMLSVPASSTSFTTPVDVQSDGTHLFVTDNSENRILVWNSIPTQQNQAADDVIGQADLNSSYINAFQPTAQNFSGPSNVHGDGTHLVVTDTANNRVLIWNQMPTSNQKAADVVIGQGLMSQGTDQNISGAHAGSSGASRRAGLSAPSALPAPTPSSGVSILSASPPAFSRSAATTTALPQTVREAAKARAARAAQSVAATGSTSGGGVSVMAWLEPTPSSQSLSGPVTAISTGSKLVVADDHNARVLIWNTLPTSNHQAADVVVGQASMDVQYDSFNATLDQYTISSAQGISWDGTHLLISDTYNGRVLIWNSMPTVSGQAADLVLGEADFTSNGYGWMNTDAQSIGQPTSIFSDGTHVFVVDVGCNRVLIWNTFPTTIQQKADYVVGQPDFATCDQNSGGLSAKSLNLPSALWFDGTRLYVSDSGNNRVLIWSAIPRTNFKAANYVLGQPDFVSTSPGLSEQQLYNPGGIYTSGNMIWVTDTGNNRVLLFERP